jgi:hypothetical protein
MTGVLYEVLVVSDIQHVCEGTVADYFFPELLVCIMYDNNRAIA